MNSAVSESGTEYAVHSLESRFGPRLPNMIENKIACEGCYNEMEPGHRRYLNEKPVKSIIF